MPASARRSAGNPFLRIALRRRGPIGRRGAGLRRGVRFAREKRVEERETPRAIQADFDQALRLVAQHAREAAVHAAKVLLAQQDVRSHPDADAQVCPILYRPFDTRATYYTGTARGFICRPREDVMRHVLAGPNLGLISTGQTRDLWAVLATRSVIGHKALAAYDINNLFPLYRYPEETDEMELRIADRTPNLAPEFTAALASSVGLDFTPERRGDIDATFGPEDVFHYVYAVLHSPEYRRRYTAFLKSDFPRVPLPGSRALFLDLAGLGARLTALHLMEANGEDAPAFAVIGGNRVERVRHPAHLQPRGPRMRRHPRRVVLE